MKTRGAWLFGASLVVVVASLLFAWGGGEAAVEPVVADVPVTPAPAATPAAVPAGDPSPVAAEAPPADEAMRVMPITSDAEREQTLASRKAALPVFLKGADESIAKLQADIARARDAGADDAEVAAMQARLDAMHRVREEVLARNADIRG